MSLFTLWLHGGYVGETTDANSALTAASLAAHSTGAIVTVVDEEDGANGCIRFADDAEGKVETFGLPLVGPA